MVIGSSNKEKAEGLAGAQSNLPVTAKLNPEGMLSQYKNASLEFGSASRNSADSTATLGSDKSQGAFRLAKQLELFTTSGLTVALAYDDTSDTSDSQVDEKGNSEIAELQLQTARKLRQVSVTPTTWTSQTKHQTNTPSNTASHD